MLRIVNLEEIQGALMRVPDLIDRLTERDPDFVPDVKRWLRKLEKTLDNNRMAVAGNVAALRGLLISSERGIIPAGVVIHGRVTGRKIRDAAAALVVREIGDLVSGAIHKDQERIAEAERLGRQLVAMANARGLIREFPSGVHFQEMLKAIWSTMSNEPELSPGTTSLVGLVGPYDALVVLDRAIASDIPRE